MIEPDRTTKHGLQWLTSLENHVPARMWNAPVATVEAPALLLALQAINPHERARNLSGDCVPETVRRIRQQLDSIFEDCTFHGRCSTNPAARYETMVRRPA